MTNSRIFQRLAALEARSDSMQRSINVMQLRAGLHVPDQEPLAKPPPGYTVEYDETGEGWRWYSPAVDQVSLESSREKARAAAWTHYMHTRAPFIPVTEHERLRNEIANYRTQCAAGARVILARAAEIKRLNARLADECQMSARTSRDCNATALERNALRDANTKLVWEVKALSSKLDERDAERAELRRDADRYRKLRALQKQQTLGPFYFQNHDGDIDADLDARDPDCPECGGRSRGCVECGGSPQQE